MSLTIKSVTHDPYKYIMSCECHKCDKKFSIEYINEKYYSLYINYQIHQEALRVIYEVFKDHMRKKHIIDFMLTGGI